MELLKQENMTAAAVTDSMHNLKASALDFTKMGSLVAYVTDFLNKLSLTQTPETPSGLGFFSNGEHINVRVLTVEDSAALADFLQYGLSDESRQKRFLTTMPNVSHSVAEYLADRDGCQRVGLITTVIVDGVEKIVGLAEYALAPGETTTPEVALAVADNYQHRGIGGHLLTLLATLSVAAGYLVWSASLLEDNDTVVNTLEKVGTVDTVKVSGGIREITVTLDQNKIFKSTTA